MPTRKPCDTCAAYGTRTMTSARSVWTVEGGVRVACAERPVCRECQRQAAHYPTEAEVRSSAAALLGRKGGSVRSEAKAAAVRANGRRGGRPGRVHIAVIQPTLSVGEPGWEDSGTVISRHRTVEAAQAAIDRAHAALRRQPGAGQSWYDWHIVRVDAEVTTALWSSR